MLTWRSTFLACSLVLAACSGGVANPPTPFGGEESTITGDENPNPPAPTVRESSSSSSSSSQGSGSSSNDTPKTTTPAPPATTAPPVTDAGTGG
jgi:hypothetical protein